MDKKLPHERLLHYPTHLAEKETEPESPFDSGTWRREPPGPERLAMARYIVAREDELRKNGHLLGPDFVIQGAQSMGDAHLLLGNGAAGRRWLEEALGLALQRPDRDTLGAIMLSLIRCCYEQGDVDASLRYLEAMVAMAQREREPIVESNLRSLAFQIHRARGDHAGERRELEAALPLTRLLAPKDEVMACLTHLAVARFRVGEHAGARDAYTEALALAREIGDGEHEAFVLSQLASVHFQLGEYRESGAIREELLARARAAGDRARVRAVLCDLGVTWSMARDFPRSAACLEEALGMIVQDGDPVMERTVRANLGAAYIGMDQHERAIAEMERALGTAGEDDAGHHVLLSNLGDAYLHTGQVHRAIPMLREALDRSRAAGDREREMGLLNQLGDAHAALGTSGKALDYYRRNLEVVGEVGDRLVELVVLERMGHASAQTQPQRALKYFEWKLAIAREIGEPEHEGMALYSLGELERRLGRRELSERHMREALAVLTAAGSPLADRPRAALAEWEVAAGPA